MKKLIISCAFFLLSLSPAFAIQPLTKTGGPAIDFNLTDTNGKQVNLKSYIGKKPVLLFFWTTWCPFCRQAFQKIEERYPEMEEAGWEVLGINVGESALRVSNYLKNSPVSFKVLLDINQHIAQIYEVMGVPTYLVIDKNGVVTFRDNYFPDGRFKKEE